MAEFNIKLNVKNLEGTYDNLYPETKKELVAGLDEALESKVDKVEGKGLSTNDFTNEDKEALDNIAAGSLVRSVAGKTGEVTLDKADVGLANVENKSSETIRSEITSADVKTALGFTPENSINKGAINGYASLDAYGKVPISQMPDSDASKTYIVSDEAARLELIDLGVADKCFETLTGDSYIYDGSDWLIMADADWKNVNLQWGNIVDKPSATVEQLNDAATKAHEHINKSILDKVVETEVNPSYDLSKFVTMADLDFGDMKKEVYDSTGNGKVDIAETAESVDWVNVQSKPEAFVPVEHGHDAEDILEDTTKQFVSAQDKLNWNSKVNVEVASVQPTTQVAGDLWFQIV